MLPPDELRQIVVGPKRIACLAIETTRVALCVSSYDAMLAELATTHGAYFGINIFAREREGPSHHTLTLVGGTIVCKNRATA